VEGPPIISEGIDAVREVGVERRLAADTDAQWTAASYAPGPCRVSREPASGAANRRDR